MKPLEPCQSEKHVKRKKLFGKNQEKCNLEFFL